jgi:hypothetical protein
MSKRRKDDISFIETSANEILRYLNAAIEPIGIKKLSIPITSHQRSISELNSCLPCMSIFMEKNGTYSKKDVNTKTSLSLPVKIVSFFTNAQSPEVNNPHKA